MTPIEREYLLEFISDEIKQTNALLEQKKKELTNKK